MDEPTPVTERNPPVAGVQVEMTATPLGELELAAVLRDAHTFVAGDPPSVKCLGVAWAHNAFEHAHGKAIWCHNIGNVTADHSWFGDYYVITFKRSQNPYDAPAGGKAPTFTMRFRSHDDFIDGARDYWKEITTTFVSALPSFDAGDPRTAVQKLKASHYFTAPEHTYEDAVAWLYNYFMSHVLPSL